MNQKKHSHSREELMGKLNAVGFLLMVVLVCQPLSALAQTPQENTAKIEEQFEKKVLGESQTPSPIYITLVNPLPESPIGFSNREFKQELQHKLALQFRFSLAIQILAWMIGFLTLVVGLPFRRRMSELDHRKCVP